MHVKFLLNHVCKYLLYDFTFKYHRQANIYKAEIPSMLSPEINKFKYGDKGGLGAKATSIIPKIGS